MRRLAPAALAAALALGNACAAEDFAYSAPLRLDGRGGLFVAEATPALYAGLARADLGDLRVRNGAGETVPHAVRLPPAPAPAAPALVALPAFALHAAPGAEAGTLSVRIEQRTGGAIVGIEGAQRSPARPRLAGYVVDASAFDGRIEALHVEWDGTGFAGRVRVESSDDLDRWTVRAADAPLMALAHDGQTLAARRIAIPATQAKYLRITWPAAQDTPAFAAVRAEPAPERPERSRTWQRVAATPGERPGDYRLDLGGRPPVDRLRVELPMNAVLPLQVLARADASQPWRLVAGTTLYRLERGGTVIARDEIAVASRGEREWLLRADPRAGLGSTPPQVAAGYVPHELVFAARGSPPFTLVFGDPRADGTALPVATLVPGYRDDAPLAAARAVIEAPQPLARPARRWPAWLDVERIDARRAMLWAVLVAGVLALGVLAWRLARQSS